MRYHVTVRDVTFEVEIDPEGVRLDGDTIEACSLDSAGPNLYSFLAGGASHTILAERGGPGVWDVQLRGRRCRVEVADDRTKAMLDMSSAGSAREGPVPVRAPMPGLVLKVEVTQGELVEAGGGLLVVEAMKMENSLTASIRGRIGAIHVVAGQTVEKDDILMDLHPPDEESE